MNFEKILKNSFLRNIFRATASVALLVAKFCIQDTHQEKAPSNKTPALTKSKNMGIWVVGTSNQLFEEVLKLKQSFQKNKVVTGKNSILCDRSILYSPFYLS